jgi:phenylacetic acid degradation operon negative regulatory protein
MLPTPKSLILNLLLAANGEPLSASDAVTSCQLFGIRENSVRVALVRLNSAGLIESVGRGAYRLGPQAASLAADVASWRHAEQRVCEWDGGWLAVSTAGLRRSDRSALRQRERALALSGFEALSPELHVRPDNLAGHANAARLRLRQLGLENEALVFVARDFAPDVEQAARQLWRPRHLDEGYTHTRQKLETWLAGSGRLDLEAAARESYVLGNEAIRQLVFDPLLPDPLVDTQARRAFRQAVIDFDAAGHGIWQRLLSSLRGDRAQGLHTATPLSSSPPHRAH